MFTNQVIDTFFFIIFFYLGHLQTFRSNRPTPFIQSDIHNLVYLTRVDRLNAEHLFILYETETAPKYVWFCKYFRVAYLNIPEADLTLGSYS